MYCTLTSFLHFFLLLYNKYNMSKLYDYTIIGAGPSGLICSYYLSKKGYKVLLLESTDSIGGCHRVTKNNDNLHMEHSPRIYPSSFLNFFNFLEKELDIKKNIAFTKYKFQVYSLSMIKFISKISLLDMSKIYYVFFKYKIFRFKISDKYTVLNFANDYNLSSTSLDVINNFCNLIDGGDSDKTLLSTLLDSMDGLGLYPILQPTLPMDKLIFNKLEEKLIKQNVDILLNNNVNNIIKNKKYLQIFTQKQEYFTNKIIFAIPPYAINKINNAVEVLGYDKIQFNNWCNYSLYKDYISFSFEFEKQIENTKEIWGGISTHPWGEIFIDYVNYFKNQKTSLIVITISNLDIIDPKTGKTANQMNKNELIQTVKNILKENLKINIEPIKSDIYPYVQKVNNKWEQQDKSFLITPQGILKPKFYPKNIYTVGHHTGFSHHTYNTIESAVINSYVFLNSVEKFNFKILRSTPLSNYLLIILVIILCIHLYLNKEYFNYLN